MGFFLGFSIFIGNTPKSIIFPVQRRVWHVPRGVWRAMVLVSAGRTQIEQKKEILDLKSRYFGVFNPLSPPYQGDF